MADQKASPPTEYGSLERFLRLFGIMVGGSGFVAFVIYFVGENSFDGVAVWLTRLIAVAVLGFGLVGWKFPLKPTYLEGEENEWYVLQGWDKRTVGFVEAGISFIKPIQRVERWKRVQPLFIKHDVSAQNKTMDTFDVHLRVHFVVDPSGVLGANALWLKEQYPEGIVGMTKGMLTDAATDELRKISSFSQVVEKEAEEKLKHTINRKFAFLGDKGIRIDELATFVDIMVSKDVLMQRVQARAEWSTMQIIRDVAHDLGISTDELLIQRALERLPDSRSRQSVGEIAAVLQLLRSESTVSPQIQSPIPEGYDQPEVIYDELVDENGEIIDQEFDTRGQPRTFVEGQYVADDPNDPDPDDDEASRSYYSPF
jgi:hypothetical protein